jgi:hypothetical protein
MRFLTFTSAELAKLWAWNKVFIFVLLVLLVTLSLGLLFTFGFRFAESEYNNLSGLKVTFISLIVYLIYFLFVIFLGGFVVTYNHLERHSNINSFLSAAKIDSLAFHYGRLFVILVLSYILASISFWLNYKVFDKVLSFEYGGSFDISLHVDFLKNCFFILLASLTPILLLIYAFSWFSSSSVFSWLFVFFLGILSFLNWPLWFFLGSFRNGVKILGSLERGYKAFGFSHQISLYSGVLVSVLFLAFLVPFGIVKWKINKSNR